MLAFFADRKLEDDRIMPARTVRSEVDVDLAILADLLEGNILRNLDAADRIRLAAIQLTIIRCRLDAGIYDRPSPPCGVGRGPSPN